MSQRARWTVEGPPGSAFHEQVVLPTFMPHLAREEPPVFGTNQAGMSLIMLLLWSSFHTFASTVPGGPSQEGAEAPPPDGSESEVEEVPPPASAPAPVDPHLGEH